MARAARKTAPETTPQTIEPTIKLVTESPFDHSPEGWTTTLGRKLTPSEKNWLASFTVSKAGNLTRKGFITDNKIEGSLSLAFRLTVFQRKDYTKRWNYVIGIDPKAKEEADDQIFGNHDYPDPFTAVLAVQDELKNGGFTIETGPMLASSLRARFRKKLREERGAN